MHVYIFGIVTDNLRSSLLTAYSILLTRIQAISTSFSQAAVIAKPSQPALDPSSSEASSSTPAPIPVPLNRILLHPRLPQTTDTTDFLTVIALTTQQPFPAVKQAQDDLIKKALEEDGQEDNGVQGKTDEELESMLDALKSRLGREHNRASLVADYIRGLEDEYEWQGRIDDEDDAEDEAQDSAGEGKGGDGTAAKPVTIDVDMDESNKKADEDTKARWTLDDWVRYRETGRQPAS